MTCSERAEEAKAKGISVAMTGFGRSSEVEYFERQKESSMLRLFFHPSCFSPISDSLWSWGDLPHSFSSFLCSLKSWEKSLRRLERWSRTMATTLTQQLWTQILIKPIRNCLGWLTNLILNLSGCHPLGWGEGKHSFCSRTGLDLADCP